MTSCLNNLISDLLHTTLVILLAYHLVLQPHNVHYFLLFYNHIRHNRSTHAHLFLPFSTIYCCRHGLLNWNIGMECGGQLFSLSHKTLLTSWLDKKLFVQLLFIPCAKCGTRCLASIMGTTSQFIVTRRMCIGITLKLGFYGVKPICFFWEFHQWPCCFEVTSLRIVHTLHIVVFLSSS
mgnify:CR=1 FL=1